MARQAECPLSSERPSRRRAQTHCGYLPPGSCPASVRDLSPLLAPSTSFAVSYSARLHTVLDPCVPLLARPGCDALPASSRATRLTWGGCASLIGVQRATTSSGHAVAAHGISARELKTETSATYNGPFS